MTAPQQAAIASQAVHELRKLAHEGHREAVVALRDVALHAIALLDDLELGDAAKQSTSWPVVWAAIFEKRKVDFDRAESLEIGSGLGIRLKGKGRGFYYNEQTGFALDVFREMESIRTNPRRHFHPADEHPELAAPGVLTVEQSKRTWRNLSAVLPPLTTDSLEDWVTAGMELCRDDCEGDFDAFPWPSCIMAKVGEDTDGNGTYRTAESAVIGRLKLGLRMLT
jgi:hypothetical protein